MRALRRFAAGLIALLRPARTERELDAELQAYLDAAIEARMRGGATREAAIRAARLDMGSAAAIKDRVRDGGWEVAAESVWQDIRYGLRTLRRTPAFTGIAIAVLALGIGASGAIFALLNVVMLRTLPVRDPAQLVEPLSRYPGEPRTNGFSWDFYQHVRDRSTSFADVGGIAPARLQVASPGTPGETVEGEFVTGAFFRTLGLTAKVGRLIEPDDARAGATPVAALSWSYWNRRFDLNPAIVGTQIVINGVPTTIVGVAPRVFTGLRTGVMPGVWIPATRPMPLGLIARLKTGVSREQANAELRVLDRWRVEQIAARSHDARWLSADIELAPAATGLSALRDRVASPLLVLMTAVGILLLLACTNLASMLLARGAGRRHEMAVRVSLGAGRLRLFRQVLTESLLLAAAGGAGGLLVGAATSKVLVRMMTAGRAPVGGWPPQLEMELTGDARLVLFTVAAAITTAVLFGLVPAWAAFTSPPITSLRQTGRIGDGRVQRLFGHGLVVTQVALSVVLVSAAAMFAGHLSHLRSQDLGFQPHGVLLVTLDPHGSGLDRNQLSQSYRELLDRFHGIPGVRSATLSAVTPIEGGAASRFVTVDGQAEAPEARTRVLLNWVSPRFFATLGTPVIAGRDFEFEDASRPHVAIVNQALARHYFADANPLGRRISLERETLPYEIVGVVADAKYSDLREPAPRTVYLSAFQDGRIFSQFSLRTSAPPATLAAQVRSLVRQVLPSLAVAKVTTLDDQLNASLVLERMLTTLSVVFGVVAAVLAALGIYGLLGCVVARRTSEIGVRMALGATRSDVVRMVLAGGSGLVAGGVAIGAPLAWWSQRLAARLLPNLSSGPGWAIALAAGTLLAVALLSAYVPARRASRVQPIDALRHA